MSRALSKRFIEIWQRKHPDGAIIHSDLNMIGIARVGSKSITCMLLPVLLNANPRNRLTND